MYKGDEIIYENNNKIKAFFILKFIFNKTLN